MTAAEIAASRPPDRVTYSDWEPVHGPERTRMVATAWSVFTVREYTQVTDRPITEWRRKRAEWWDQQPGQPVARWEWEYRPA